MLWLGDQLLCKCRCDLETVLPLTAESTPRNATNERAVASQSRNAGSPSEIRRNHESY